MEEFTEAVRRHAGLQSERICAFQFFNASKLPPDVVAVSLRLMRQWRRSFILINRRGQACHGRQSAPRTELIANGPGVDGLATKISKRRNLPGSERRRLLRTQRAVRDGKLARVRPARAVKAIRGTPLVLLNGDIDAIAIHASAHVEKHRNVAA
jgi:hypothetical protein